MGASIFVVVVVCCLWNVCWALVGTQQTVDDVVGKVAADKRTRENWRHCVLRIHFTVSTPGTFTDGTLPWRYSPYKSGGSAFIIEGRRIMTNAHVVRDTTQLLVKKATGGRRYVARRVATSHEMDLALLTVDDDSFWEGCTPFQFSDTPLEIGQDIIALGFSEGKAEMSVDPGKVTSLEVASLSVTIAYGTLYFRGDAWPSYLSLTHDSNVWFGNSGGPILSTESGKVVAITSWCDTLMGTEAGSGAAAALHFLRDVDKHGGDSLSGIGMLGGLMSTAMRNPMAAKFFGLSKLAANRDEDLWSGVTMPEGVLVRGVDQPWIDHSRRLMEGKFDAEHIGLQVDDVLLRLNGFDIGFDNTVRLGAQGPCKGTKDESLRVSSQYAISQKFAGEGVEALVMRGGRLMSVHVPLSANNRTLLPVHDYDWKPPYFVFGGLVFTPVMTIDIYTRRVYFFSLNRKLINGQKLKNVLPYLNRPSYKAVDGKESERELIVLTSVLGTSLTDGIGLREGDSKDATLENGVKLGRSIQYTRELLDSADAILRSVNGVDVRNVQHLIDLVDTRDLASDGEIVEFGFEGGWLVVMNRTEVALATPKILEDFYICHDRRV